MPVPQVSILINNYNYGRNLGVAIESALVHTIGQFDRSPMRLILVCLSMVTLPLIPHRPCRRRATS